MARLIDADQIENKFIHWLNKIAKDITNDTYQGSEGDDIMACLEEIRAAPTIDPESLRPRGRCERMLDPYGKLEGFIHVECGFYGPCAHTNTAPTAEPRWKNEKNPLARARAFT